ncbi:uncharacterized protein LOC116773915 isoform X2 [Danaus plexippus]|uniref:uncharacterized protein LOC116773915 isoform X2 n=1 Tax=Danaus plexippus TaxID=13037 RepID=UPI002AB09DE2|nr:uncharacterized protein LOC116773915 isoform X2 [Danaus plexippus]
MDARVFVFSVLIFHTFIYPCVTVMKINTPEISKSKTELTPLFISAKLNNIIIISAPIIDSFASYYLSKPNGEEVELNLNISHSIQGIKAQGGKKHDNYLNNSGQLKALKSNDFIIGPLDENDHGNWVLSVFYKEDGDWTEMFQIITIEIIDTISAVPEKPSLHIGEDFYVRFANPLYDLESCQIVAPKSAFDRYFNRNNVYQNACGFHIPNVTYDDEGMWKIIGVGKIVYEANVYLNIKINVT